MSKQKRNYRETSLVWPLVLIGIGVVFLLENLNIIEIDIWQMITHLWPLILVAVGLDILFGRRAGIWQGISVLIVISIFAAGAWLIRNTGDLIIGDLYSQEFSQPLEDADRGKIDIEMGVGGLRINPIHNSTDLLVNGEIVLAEGEVLDQDFRTVGDTAYFQLKSDGPEFSPSRIINFNGEERIWQINLTDMVPLDLMVDLGVGQSLLDLRGLEISRLDVNIGIGEVVIYLPESGDFSANISGGIGKLTVNVPSNMAVRLNVDNGLGNTRISGIFNQQDGTYFTGDYFSAEDKIDLNIDGGIGEIIVVVVD